MNMEYLLKDEKLMSCLSDEIDGVFSLRGYCNIIFDIDLQNNVTVELPLGKVLIKFVEETDEFLKFSAAYGDLIVPLNVKISNVSSQNIIEIIT